MRRDFPGCGAALADRNAHDHKIGAFDRRRVGVEDPIRPTPINARRLKWGAAVMRGSRPASAFCRHPPLKGEGRTAEGSPGWGDSDTAYADWLSPPPGPLTRSDLPPPGGGDNHRTRATAWSLSGRPPHELRQSRDREAVRLVAADAHA